MKNNHIRNIVFAGLCIALCIVLPMAFHMFPNGGSVFCPMHIPVLICGLVCGWQYGLLCGIVGPLLSSLLTGMPPAPMLPSMMCELAVYGVVTALLMKAVHTKNTWADLYISLVGAMLAGRVVAGIVKALIFARGEMTMSIWFTTHFVTALPGIAVHLVFIPAIVAALIKAKILPPRYPAKTDAAAQQAGSAE